MRAALLAARNGDGGWPYYPGRASRLEPTLFAILALNLDPQQVLAGWKRRSALFLDAADQVNYGFNGEAGLVLAKQAGSPMALALVKALVASRGERLPASTVSRQDDTIQGWSWTPGTFSWLEPTAWCLLGLKKLTAGYRDDSTKARVNEGERLLADRACKDGGWNYGNSNVVGSELAPQVHTTALALLALRDRAALPHVDNGLQRLEQLELSETGGLALSLAMICLALYSRPIESVRSALVGQWRRRSFLGNLHLTALGLYALSTGASHYEAFRV